MDKSKYEELIEHFNSEVIASVINQALRAGMVKSRMNAKIGDENGDIWCIIPEISILSFRGFAPRLTRKLTHN
jgi:hypothetical protein